MGLSRASMLAAKSAAMVALALMLVLFAGAAGAALDFPALGGRVTDQAGVLSQPARTALTEKLKNLEDKSGIQLVVATVRSLQGADIESYANGLFRDWKLGLAKKNNGVLFLVAPGDRKMRIEVGYGLEGVLTDAVSSVIIRTAVAPRFKAGDFDGGVEKGVDAIIEVLSTDTSEWTRRAAAQSSPDALDDLAPLLLFLLFVFIIIYMSRNARGGGRGGGPFIILPPSGGSGWGGGSSGWGGGGGSFGGDGGFSGGGGSSGGGGASGDW